MSKLDKNKVIDLYKDGMTYGEIAEFLVVNRDTIKKCIQRNIPNEIHNKRNMFLQKIFSLYKDGLSFKSISDRLNIKESTIKSIIYKHIPEEVEKRRIKKKLPQRLYFLTAEDIKIIWERKRHMLFDHETIGTSAFVKWNRQSYITTKSGNLKFDINRGGLSFGTPSSFCKRS